MKKFLMFFFVFWWAMIFPNLSFNQFTTELTNQNISYSDLFSTKTRERVFKNLEYDLWIKTILSSNK